MIRGAKYALWIALGVALSITLHSAPALADDAGVKLTIYEIRASNDKGSSDPELSKGPLAKKLQKGPFRSWSKFEKLAKHDEKAKRLEAKVVELQPGGKLSVLYRDRMKSQGKKDRLRLSVAIDKKDGKRRLDTTVELDAGDFFLVGGSSLPGGATYILAISVR